MRRELMCFSELALLVVLANRAKDNKDEVNSVLELQINDPETF